MCRSVSGPAAGSIPPPCCTTPPKLRRTRLKTFSIAFESKSCDERDYFREIAQIYGTEHHEFELNPGSELASAIEDLAYYSDEPGADAGALPVWFLSKMSRQHVTVALSGEGGDELFGGYLTYRADRSRAASPPHSRVSSAGPLCFRPRRFIPVSTRRSASNTS